MRRCIIFAFLLCLARSVNAEVLIGDLYLKWDAVPGAAAYEVHCGRAPRSYSRVTFTYLPEARLSLPQGLNFCAVKALASRKRPFVGIKQLDSPYSGELRLFVMEGFR